MPLIRLGVSRRFLAAALAAGLVGGLPGCADRVDRPAPAPGTLTPDQIAQIVASPDRSAADRTNDVRRHPEQMLAFIGVQPGIAALDVSTGGGYTTELLARAIGPAGVVYAQAQPRDPNRPPPKPAEPEGGAAPAPAPAPAPIPGAAPPPPRPRPSAEAVAERSAHLQAAGIAAAPIVFVSQSFDDPVPPLLADEKLDLVTLMFNYHDFGFLGVDRVRMNRAIFRALKPGGILVVADHAGRTGTGIGESGTLHRIEEAFLRKEIEAAGFKLVEEGMFLRNPNDPRDRNTPEPPQPKDEFVLKFVKP